MISAIIQNKIILVLSLVSEGYQYNNITPARTNTRQFQETTIYMKAGTKNE